MASDKGKQVWIIWVLVVIAVIFVVLAFQKDKSQEAGAPLSAPDAVQDVPGDVGAVSGEPDSMKPKESVVMAPKQSVPKDSFAIQVYSFKDKVRADAALETLRQKGHENAYIMTSDLGVRGIFYRVRVGPFANEGEAQTVLEKINVDLKSGIIVTE